MLCSKFKKQMCSMFTGVKISKSCQGSLRLLILYFWGISLSFKAPDFLFFTYAILWAIGLRAHLILTPVCSTPLFLIILMFPFDINSEKIFHHFLLYLENWFWVPSFIFPFPLGIYIDQSLMCTNLHWSVMTQVCMHFVQLLVAMN